MELDRNEQGDRKKDFKANILYTIGSKDGGKLCVYVCIQTCTKAYIQYNAVYIIGLWLITAKILQWSETQDWIKCF